MSEAKWIHALWRLFEKELFPVPSTETLFNQYKDTDPRYDLPGGAEIRRKNLKNYLKGFSNKTPRVLVVGEAAGPWGCRFSGIPFTGERRFERGELPFKGKPSSLSEPPYVERSGTVLWGALIKYYPDFFLYNAVPLQPHKKGKPLTIRTPSNKEIAEFSGLLKKIAEIIRPEVIAAVGRKAEHALGLAGLPGVYVRHPSRGGAGEFKEGMRRVFEGRIRRGAFKSPGTRH